MKDSIRWIIVIGVALLLRAAWATLVPCMPVSDSVAYDTFARTLAQHGVYGWNPDQPSAYWPVGTSAIYAALYFLFGVSYTPIVALNVALSTAIVALTMAAAARMFDQRMALFAGWLMAVWPSEVAYVTILASEVPFTFFILTAFVAWFSPGLTRWGRGLVIGTALAAATYIRPIALLLPFVFCLSALPRWRTTRSRIPEVMLATAIMIAIVGPWSVRNFYRFDHVVLVSTNGGTNFWMGNNPDTRGFYMPLPAWTDGLDEYQRDKALGAAAIDYVLADPAGFVLRTAKKVVLLHLNETIGVHWNADGITASFGNSSLLPMKILHQAFWAIVLSIAAVGMLLHLLKRGLVATVLHPAVLVWAYFTAVYAATAIQDRYHFPSHPFIAMLAGFALASISTRARKDPLRHTRQAS